MKIGLRIIAGSMLLVLLEALLAYQNGSFWPNQVMERWGEPGIAFVAHGGMWGDLVLLPPLFAYIITRYGASWSNKQITVMAIVGILVTLANHLLLVFTQVIPDPLGWQKESWSWVIALHFVYMSTYVALVGLFYFSSDVSVRIAVTVSVALGIHMAFGTHVPLGMLNRLIGWPWCPDFLGSPMLPYLTGVIWFLLAGFSAHAAGWRAGVYVLLIGAALFAGVATFAHLHPVTG